MLSNKEKLSEISEHTNDVEMPIDLIDGCRELEAEIKLGFGNYKYCRLSESEYPTCRNGNREWCQ